MKLDDLEVQLITPEKSLNYLRPAYAWRFLKQLAVADLGDWGGTLGYQALNEAIKKIGIYAGKNDCQREFNVAASRAREQMILFHSATLNDLKETCLQYKLLKHCQNPQVQQLPCVNMSIDELRLKARQTERRRGNQPSPFDSWFEVDVYLKLAARGYRIIPQYVVNPYEKSYRIDIVVEGLNGRLAVECDGDEWHGPAQYEKDMSRQRELERCGWEFWRVRGGAFYREGEAAMSTLWDALKCRGIFPEGYVPQVDSVKNESHVQQSNPVNNNEAISNLHDDQEDSFSANLSEEEIGDSKKRAQDLTPKEIQESLIEVLKRRPNNSIAVKAVASEICREVGVRTRGAPRRDLDKRIKRSIGVLKSQGRVEEYKSKNLRIRLK